MNKMTKANLMESWIQEIREKDNYYCFDGWKYRISGTVIELSIVSVYTKNRNKYRCSAITIGQILKTLSTRIENGGLHFHIQSFPSIENPEIIATIRIDENGHLPEVFPKIKNDKGVKTFRNWIFQLSEKYQFNLQEIQRPKNYHPGFTSKKPAKWFALTSLSDNPFTWLNLGNWKETILDKAMRNFPETQITVYDFCKNVDVSAENVNIAEDSFLQALIVFAE